ncbi:DUF6801 domain-containing protein [Amycolatopsis nigrescens]|uniref:DUF6801 domain-containing protein n=1 Tax=Amycolatopsis nigrescens TaxID=381445 RepID=UPI0004773FCF|nr:DUF6801 domain-containing protein [Amycolatopsis nigrescens]
MAETKLKTVRRQSARAGIVASIVAILVGLFGGGMANAAEKSLTFKGAFPIIGEQSVTAVVKAEIPATATGGQALSVPFTLDVDAGVAAGDGLRLVGATKISGNIKSSVTIKLASGDTVPLPVELPIPETPVPPEGALTFSASGTVEFTVPAGTPAGTATTSVDPEAVSHVVTDSDLGEFDVNLALDPPDQDTVLGTTEIS